MASGRMELEGEPGRYVSGGKARKLLGLGQARVTAQGSLALLPGAPNADELAPERTYWTGRSRGFEMNGKAINRGVTWE